MELGWITIKNLYVKGIIESKRYAFEMDQEHIKLNDEKEIIILSTYAKKVLIGLEEIMKNLTTGSS